MEEIARLQQTLTTLLEEAGHRTKTEVRSNLYKWCMHVAKSTVLSMYHIIERQAYNYGDYSTFACSTFRL